MEQTTEHKHWNQDPVFYAAAGEVRPGSKPGWYSWDETWSDVISDEPCATRRCAEDALSDYARDVLGVS